MKWLSILILFLINIDSCKKETQSDTIDRFPTFTEKDQEYADVFKELDGVWKGKFLIYEDHQRLPKDKIDLKNISIQNLQKKGLELINSIEVEQKYVSETSYFQKVVIKDTYPDTGQTIISNGVNKIEDGQMWCIVQKPDETVIHKGYTEGKHTIIWQRDEKSPQKIEYFKETVSQDFYEIIGWGYYQGDDTNLSPRLWFYSKYKRQKSE
ncbi:hypothetical protein [Aquimarina sp. 2201CG5-10]|uniref:hypothetical protein n=1 Tax=Aquimarina callyspongiae TaxID=3098150 RepID=UPI002AB3D8C5|nr:hypothetical protein [Aquimarina sp. 2201CG5-10]MDY8135199.1 hypothetical protein [Aquimarina sp. 2201CG5-10]